MGLFLELLAGLVALVGFLGLAGVLYQAIGSARDARKYPAPGQKVDVGGHRLHHYCTGEGNPTVVLDSGLPGSTLSWLYVQPAVAGFTRVCSYDRAGLGWSDPGPMPRTSQKIACELHTLLANAGIKGPYVLVGHSFGTFTARLYASTYPDEVAGMVLVDPIHPREWLGMTEEQERQLRGAVRLSRYAALLARLGIARLIAFLVRAGAAQTARRWLSFLTGGALKEPELMLAPVTKLPLELRPIVTVFWTQPKFYQAMASQVESLPESAAQVAATNGFGDIPLVVLSASNPGPARMAEQDALARLSSHGRHLVAARSGHWIQLDQPELVIEAIRQVVESARRRQARVSYA